MAETVKASAPGNPFAKKASGGTQTTDESAPAEESQTEEAAAPEPEKTEAKAAEKPKAKAAEAPPPPPPPAADDVADANTGERAGVPAVRRPAFSVKMSELKLPTLKVAAKVGPLSDKFPAGHLIIDGSEDISDGKTAVEFTVLGAQRKWIEDKPYKVEPKPEEMANIVYSEEEVWRLGGTTEWGKDPETGKGIRPTYNEALDITILLKNPAGVDSAPSPFFPFKNEDSGDTYAILQYSLTNTAFRKCSSKFFTAYAMHLQGDWFKAQFTMTTGTTTVGGNAVICPEVNYGKMNSADFINWIKSLIPSDSDASS